MPSQPEQHRTRVMTLGQDTLTYKASCSCGWAGDARRSESEAEHDATDHVVATSTR